LIDRLEALFNQSSRVPFSSKALVDEDEFLRLIDQLRITIPQDIKSAKQVLQERDQIVREAQERAEHIVALAQEQAERLVGEHELLKRAQAEREKILAAAEAEAESIRQQADDYALNVLQALEEKLTNFQNTVRNGIELLQQQRPPKEQPSEQPAARD